MRGGYGLTIGERIRQARNEKGLTQKQLGSISGTSEITIRQYELGKRQPRIEQLQRIADALNISAYDLIDSGFGALDAVMPSNWQGVNLDHAKVDSKFLSVLLSNLTKLDRNTAVYLRSRNAIFALAESSGLADMALSFITEHEKLSDQSTNYFPNFQKLIEAFSQLNNEGQEKAVSYTEDILPRYRRQDPPEAPPAPAGDTDTPAAQDAPEGAEEGE